MQCQVAYIVDKVLDYNAVKSRLTGNVCFETWAISFTTLTLL